MIKTDNEYKEWIGELKQRIRQSQIKAAVKVNTELLKLYWSIGGDIVRLKAEAKWGDGIIEQLSQDLKTNFPDIHTWATTAYYCEIHPGIISEAMGHSSITVTETYLKPFRSKKIDEANKQVLDFVKRSVMGASA